jgi:hypothetical protein
MKRIIAVTVLTTLTAFSAQAQPFQIDPNQIQGAVQGMLMQSMFTITDANKDGQVSKAEALATAEKRFNEADVNQDGFMTKEEMQSAHQKQMQMRQQRRQERQGSGAGAMMPPHGSPHGEVPPHGQQAQPPVSVPSQY